MIRLVFALLMLPGAALACACCAERGERYAYQVEMGGYERAELARLRADGAAKLFVTACGLDCVTGLTDPQLDYGVEISVDEGGVTFGFADAQGRARGGLEMAWPEGYVLSGVDTDPLSDAPDAQLYTEMRLTGTARGTGDFASDGPLSATLIYAGRGNMCLQAAGLTHWSIDVAGEGVNYRLFGGLTAR
ncbi:hypothetical protein EI983_07760 [Roseovarius faecimaris]|uniref:Lipoprotein n=1 Tax=Roseovarius faecimaris TaxID=2494550 RepID=A0A6I6IMF6_9RHOB|nr:hypothetical protein [Roseovarius faecimaris]QGX98179.1 hypothetical protein EI983_07760 [Roseovarius faecimaris]